MIENESKFVFLVKKKCGFMTFGDNIKVMIIGHGNVANIILFIWLNYEH